MSTRTPRAKLLAMFYDRAARRFPLVGTETELEERLERDETDADVQSVLRIRERYVRWALERYEAGDVYDSETDTWCPVREGS